MGNGKKGNGNLSHVPRCRFYRLPHIRCPFFLSGCPNFRCPFFRCPFYRLPIFPWPKFSLPFFPLPSLPRIVTYLTRPELCHWDSRHHRLFIIHVFWTVFIDACMLFRRPSWSMSTVRWLSLMTLVPSLRRLISMTAACLEVVTVSSEYSYKTRVLWSLGWTANTTRPVPSPAVCDSHFSGN